MSMIESFLSSKKQLPKNYPGGGQTGSVLSGSPPNTWDRHGLKGWDSQDQNNGQPSSSGTGASWDRRAVMEPNKDQQQTPLQVSPVAQSTARGWPTTLPGAEPAGGRQTVLSQAEKDRLAGTGTTVPTGTGTGTKPPQETFDYFNGLTPEKKMETWNKLTQSQKDYYVSWGIKPEGYVAPEKTEMSFTPLHPDVRENDRPTDITKSPFGVDIVKQLIEKDTPGGGETYPGGRRTVLSQAEKDRLAEGGETYSGGRQTVLSQLEKDKLAEEKEKAYPTYPGGRQTVLSQAEKDKLAEGGEVDSGEQPAVYGPSDVDRMIEDRYLSRLGAMSESERAAESQRLLQEGKTPEEVQALTSISDVSRREAVGEAGAQMAISAAQREEDSRKWGAEFAEGMRRFDVGSEQFDRSFAEGQKRADEQYGMQTKYYDMDMDKFKETSDQRGIDNAWREQLFDYSKGSDAINKAISAKDYAGASEISERLYGTPIDFGTLEAEGKLDSFFSGMDIVSSLVASGMDYDTAKTAMDSAGVADKLGMDESQVKDIYETAEKNSNPFYQAMSMLDDDFIAEFYPDADPEEVRKAFAKRLVGDIKINDDGTVSIGDDGEGDGEGDGEKGEGVFSRPDFEDKYEGDVVESGGSKYVKTGEGANDWTKIDYNYGKNANRLGGEHVAVYNNTTQSWDHISAGSVINFKNSVSADDLGYTLPKGTYEVISKNDDYIKSIMEKNKGLGDRFSGATSWFVDKKNNIIYPASFSGEHRRQVRNQMVKYYPTGIHVESNYGDHVERYEGYSSGFKPD